MKRHVLSPEDRRTQKNALTVAAERFEENAGEFRKLAEHLRQGGAYPMFAKGEGGAQAADGFADNFERQAKDSRRLAERFEDASEVWLHVEDDLEDVDVD